MTHNSKELHVISNGKMSMEQLAEIAADICPYVTKIHLREKQKTARELYQAVNLMTKYNVPLSKIMLNDRVDVAFMTGAAGVQLASHSLEVSTVKANFPDLTLGCSIHSLKEGKQAEQNGANYVIYGHIFSTNSKPGLKPRGLEKLKKLTGLLTIPVVAIGGISPENAEQVIQTGANGIAVMSGILEARDPILAVKAYKKGIETGDV
ncbi:thiazole tautomerase TenI [Bacillota bacterium Lsc_1132]